MINPESALRASQDLYLETSKDEEYETVPISALELVLNDEIDPCYGEANVTSNEEAPVEQESRQTGNCGTKEENVIAPYVKSAIS